MLITLSLHSHLSSWALEVKFMKIGSKILKICAFLLGALCLAYGFMLGIVGAGPDGPHDSVYKKGSPIKGRVKGRTTSPGKKVTIFCLA